MMMRKGSALCIIVVHASAHHALIVCIVRHACRNISVKQDWLRLVLLDLLILGLHSRGRRNLFDTVLLFHCHTGSL
jgi:hypothetical protein